MSIQSLEIDSIPERKKIFSICTLVTNFEEYSQMLDSFQKAGFDDSECEFIHINNVGQNKYDAFKGISKFLTHANADYIIICHQDIVLNKDNYSKLKKCISEMNSNYPDWAILGNAGGIHIKKNIYRIAYPDGKEFNDGPFPQKVKTLDENFLIIKKEANIGISRDLTGYHLYGTDLCLIADILGYSSYVIDFLLTHKSFGNPDKKFYQLKEAFIQKYRQALKPRFLRTTITILYISGSSIRNVIFNLKWMISLRKFWHKMTNL